MDGRSKYDSDFFAYTSSKNEFAAEAISKLVTELLQPGSVCDVGCGEGVWLRAYQRHGVSKVLGVDGGYVDRSRLRIDPSLFLARDLSRSLDIPGRFELVQSIEVAEHLPQARASQFVECLATLGERVLFSAAVPGQGGLDHVNEQPLSYWRALFAARGFDAYDLVRPRVEGEGRISSWYRFNLLLYVSRAAAGQLPEAVRATRVPESSPLRDYSPLWYRARKRLVAALPYAVRQTLARAVSR